MLVPPPLKTFLETVRLHTPFSGAPGILLQLLSFLLNFSFFSSPDKSLPFFTSISSPLFFLGRSNKLPNTTFSTVDVAVRVLSFLASVQLFFFNVSLFRLFSRRMSACAYRPPRGT